MAKEKSVAAMRKGTGSSLGPVPAIRWELAPIAFLPHAFVQREDGARARDAEYVDWCRQNLANCKVSKKVAFGKPPTVATGKIRKCVLRERVKGL